MFQKFNFLKYPFIKFQWISKYLSFCKFYTHPKVAVSDENNNLNIKKEPNVPSDIKILAEQNPTTQKVEQKNELTLEKLASKSIAGIHHPKTTLKIRVPYSNESERFEIVELITKLREIIKAARNE